MIASRCVRGLALQAFATLGLGLGLAACSGSDDSATSGLRSIPRAQAHANNVDAPPVFQRSNDGFFTASQGEATAQVLARRPTDAGNRAAPGACAVATSARNPVIPSGRSSHATMKPDPYGGLWITIARPDRTEGSRHDDGGPRVGLPQWACYDLLTGLGPARLGSLLPALVAL